MSGAGQLTKRAYRACSVCWCSAETDRQRRVTIVAETLRRHPHAGESRTEAMTRVPPSAGSPAEAMVIEVVFSGSAPTWRTDGGPARASDADLGRHAGIGLGLSPGLVRPAMREATL
jgi:hypothetical protein